VDHHHGTVLGRVIALALVAAVLSLVLGVVVSTTRPGKPHPAATSSSAQLPLHYVTMEAQGKKWYPDNYDWYTGGIAIQKGPSAIATCGQGSQCGTIVVMSKRACPTALTLKFDVLRGDTGPTVGATTASAQAVKARTPVSLSYSYASDEAGLISVISSVSCS
jgi:hypothetical protein